ncbi:MAG TPA: PD-(D/E)XK nuclease family protein, partial [Tepidisphaeraceae bacterium]
SAGDLEHFGRSAGRPGLAGEVDRAFGEFERSGTTPADVDALIGPADEAADASRQQLGRKLRDLSKLYASYQSFLIEHQFDPYERQATVPEAISTWAGARDALVLVDEFYDFTVYERQIIVALAKAARQTFVSVMMDAKSPLVTDPNLMPEDLGLFRRTEETYRRLHFAMKSAGIAVDAPLLLSAARRWHDPAMAAVANALEGPPKKRPPAKDAVRLCLAADARDEAEVAAREIKRLLYQGYRLRDVCVLARSADSYAAHIEAAFSDHDIPYFLDRRRPAAHHPLVRTVQAIGQIVQTRWSHDGVFDLLKAGLTQVPAANVDLLADYVTQHRLTASAWTREQAWRYNRLDEDENRRLFGAEDIEAVNAAATLIRHAMGSLASPEDVEKPRKIGERVCDLLAALERLDVRGAMLKRIEALENANEIERREEEEQVWARWAELCDRLHELLGDVEATGTDFFKLLQTALDGLDLAVVPPTLDQVLVGSVDRTRVGEPKAVVLIGLNECDFPLCQQERPILNDTDRVRLMEAGMEVEPPTRQVLLMERFLGYVALTRASEKLVLIRTKCDDHGQDCSPSPFWDAVCKTLDDPQPEEPPTGLRRVTTPAQAVSHLLIWARRQHATIEAASEASLYDWMARSTDPRVTTVRDRAWPALSHRNAARLSTDVAARLFAPPLEASVSRFESFAACPFQHFARYGLRLQRPTATEFTAMDLGNLYHAVLDDMVAGTIRKKIDFAQAEGLSRDDIRGVSRRLAETIADQLFLSDARSRFTLEQLDRTVHKLLRAQQVTSGLGQMRPAYTELTFGNEARLPPVELQTPAGHAVRLRGKIDRIDIDAERQAFSVIDYKLSGESLDYGYVAYGLMLQLLTYLLVLREHGPKLFERPLPPAAALYVKVLRGIQSVTHPSDAPEPDTEPFHLKEKPRGVVARSHAQRIDPAIDAGVQSKILAYRLKQDGDFYASGQDGVDDAVLSDLIDYVRQQIAELADKIIAGEVAVAPYIINRDTPCQQCDLQRVCRIDWAINSYRPLTPLGRREAIDVIRGAKGGRHGA